MIFLFLILNFAISILNAWGVGRTWVETKVVGGFPRFMAWMAATMSAVGFTWCYLVILAFAAGPNGFHKLPANYVDAMFSLGYLIIILPCIGSGTAITLDSWAHFWRKRNIGNGALAAYNTFADIYNVYQAVRYVPKAWDTVKDLLFPKKRDSSNGFAGIAIMLALAAVFGGILTTSAIVRTVSERTAADKRLRYAQDNE